MTTNSELFSKALQAAMRVVERNGGTVLESEWQCEFGSTDLVFLDGNCLVFADVNIRRGFMPRECWTASKRQRFESIASCYVSQSDLRNVQIRFDIFSFELKDNGQAFMRHHLGVSLAARESVLQANLKEALDTLEAILGSTATDGEGCLAISLGQWPEGTAVDEIQGWIDSCRVA